MYIATNTIDLDLAKRKLYRLPDDADRVTVRAGTLWVTQRDDPRDIILEPGQSFTPDGHSKVVLYALDPASFTVQTTARGQAVARSTRQGSSAGRLVLE